MAIQRPPLRPLQDLTPAARPRARGPQRRWWLLGAVVAVVLIALAWIEGGEEPLRPIAEDVALPELGQ